MPQGIENMELAIQMTVESLYMVGLWVQESHRLRREMENQVQTSHFSKELELGGLGPSCPMGQQDGC